MLFVFLKPKKAPNSHVCKFLISICIAKKKYADVLEKFKNLFFLNQYSIVLRVEKRMKV